MLPLTYARRKYLVTSTPCEYNGIPATLFHIGNAVGLVAARGGDEAAASKILHACAKNIMKMVSCPPVEHTTIAGITFASTLAEKKASLDAERL